MDPVSILSVLGTSIAITKSVSDFLNTLITQTQSADRSLQQLSREVADFQSLLQRMSDDLADPSMQIAAFETQTGNVGAHWKAVQQAISTCNVRLKELQDLFQRLASASPGPRSISGKLLQGVRLNFADSDIQFYRSEIMHYEKTIALSLQMIIVYEKTIELRS